MLDAAVVVLGWLDIALTGDEYTFLRTVRVLRPLRTITHIKGLKVGTALLMILFCRVCMSFLQHQIWQLWHVPHTAC